MGSFLGHLVPGTFFIIVSLWWTYSILKRYYRSLYNRHADKFTSTVSFPFSGRASNAPTEGILIVTFATIGVLGEFVTGFKEGRWSHWGNAQHISMFTMFGITGVMDILYFYHCAVPPGLDYASALIAFTVEGLLFANHLHGRSHMDVLVHTLLLYLIMACAICVALEARYRNHAVPALGRAFFTFMQGTWFYQIGFILYPPSGVPEWDQEDHDQMMIVTAIFSWHFMGAFLMLFLFIALTSRLGRRDAPIDLTSNSIKYQKIDLGTLSEDENAANQLNGKKTTKTPSPMAPFTLETSEDEL